MKYLRALSCCLLVLITVMASGAEQNFELYVNGVRYKSPSIMEKGLPYFPVDILSEATGVSVVGFSEKSVRLAGSQMEFVPVLHRGRPYLPAEAFAMATGSGVEIDQTRGMVKYTRGQTSSSSRGAPGSNPSANIRQTPSSAPYAPQASTAPSATTPGGSSSYPGSTPGYPNGLPRANVVVSPNGVNARVGPGVPGGMPGAPGMPGGTPGMPGGTPGMPGGVPGMPGYTPGMPGTPGAGVSHPGFSPAPSALPPGVPTPTHPGFPATSQPPGPSAPPMTSPPAPTGPPPGAIAPAPSTRNTAGLQEVVVDAMKTAQEITYAQRYLQHKMFWLNQMDPANSPFLKVDVPPAAYPIFAPHPWSIP